MAQPMVQTPTSSTGAGSALILNTYCESFMATVAVVLTGATATYTVQYTLAPLNLLTAQGGTVWTEANAPWFSLAGMTAQTTTNAITITGPVTAVRLNIASISGGTAQFFVVQSGGIKN